MTYVEEWTQGKPRLTALFAPQIASFAREIPEILKFQKKHRLLTHTFQGRAGGTLFPLLFPLVTGYDGHRTAHEFTYSIFRGWPVEAMMLFHFMRVSEWFSLPDLADYSCKHIRYPKGCLKVIPMGVLCAYFRVCIDRNQGFLIG